MGGKSVVIVKFADLRIFLFRAIFTSFLLNIDYPLESKVRNLKMLINLFA